MSWDKFIVNNNGSFLQSYEWGEFQKAIGRKVRRIEQGDLRAQVIKHELPFGKSYLYLPKGPVVENRKKNYNRELGILAGKISEIAKQENSVFCKIEPEVSYSFSGFENKIKASSSLQPRKTLLLNLAPGEESILSQMHSKTRYNIRLASRKGVEFEEISGERKCALDRFWNLLKQTAERDNFKPHTKEYYYRMCQILGKAGMLEIFAAKYKNKIIAANLIVFFGDKAVYLHGASDHNYRKLMAPYLLQWGAILEAKRRGVKHYDFWGVDEKKWPGVTRFKKGFGGKEVSYPLASDIVFSNFWYGAYNISKKILR